MYNNPKGNVKYNYIKKRQNVSLILEHSTILPFRSTRGYFNCFYCNKRHAVFQELETHMSEHNNIDFKTIVKSIKRPQIIKADTSDISCKLCLTNLVNVSELVDHLTGVHKLVFNNEDKINAKECILPYNLSDGRYICSVCHREFNFFSTLSKHMNEHSTNYVCDKCGQCFLLPERLSAHKRLHNDKLAVKCEECGRICSSNILLKSHIRYYHTKVVYSCFTCNEAFKSFKQRLRHMVEKHGKKINLTCGVCKKNFETTTGLKSHNRTEHLRIKVERKYSCDDCPMKFTTRYALKCHIVTHSRERNFECEICHKRYGRSNTLVEHLKIHRNDKRWSCGECGQAFVQKCSLRNHIRVHHNRSDLDMLILYKKKSIGKQ